MKDLIKFPLQIQFFNDDGGNNGSENGNSGEETISKAIYDKKVNELNTKLKEANQKLTAKMTEDEKKNAADKEKDAELEDLRNYKKASTIREGLLGQGISKESADKITESILKGDVADISKVIGEEFKLVTGVLQKEIDTLKLTGIDKPDGGSSTDTITASQFKTMTIDEKIALKNSNPELYKTLKG